MGVDDQRVGIGKCLRPIQQLVGAAADVARQFELHHDGLAWRDHDDGRVHVVAEFGDRVWSDVGAVESGGLHAEARVDVEDRPAAAPREVDEVADDVVVVARGRCGVGHRDAQRRGRLAGLLVDDRAVLDAALEEAVDLVAAAVDVDDGEGVLSTDAGRPAVTRPCRRDRAVPVRRGW